MKCIIRRSKIFILGLLALALLPASALADQPKTEVVSIQVDLASPHGMTVIGTVVAHRTCGAVITTDISFNGMINGQPANGTATAVEHWLGAGKEDVDVTAITSWNAAVESPQPSSWHVEQDAPGLLTANGLPLAIDGWLQAPCSGRTTYSLAMAGQGSAPITRLPNMGAGPGSQPAASTSAPGGSAAVLALPASAAGVQALFAVLLLMSASLGLAGLRLVLKRRGA